MVLRLDIGQISFIWSKIHLQHDSLPFLPLALRFATYWLRCAQKSIFFPFAFSPFLFAAVIDLLLGLLAVKKTSKEASSRWPIFTKEQPSVVAGNFAPSFPLNFLSICVHISGSIRPITLIRLGIIGKIFSFPILVKSDDVRSG